MKVIFDVEACLPLRISAVGDCLRPPELGPVSPDSILSTLTSLQHPHPGSLASVRGDIKMYDPGLSYLGVHHAQGIRVGKLVQGPQPPGEIMFESNKLELFNMLHFDKSLLIFLLHEKRRIKIKYANNNNRKYTKTDLKA